MKCGAVAGFPVFKATPVPLNTSSSRVCAHAHVQVSAVHYCIMQTLVRRGTACIAASRRNTIPFCVDGAANLKVTCQKSEERAGGLENRVWAGMEATAWSEAREETRPGGLAGGRPRHPCLTGCSLSAQGPDLGILRAAPLLRGLLLRWVGRGLAHTRRSHPLQSHAVITYVAFPSTRHFAVPKPWATPTGPPQPAARLPAGASLRLSAMRLVSHASCRSVHPSATSPLQPHWVIRSLENKQLPQSLRPHCLCSCHFSPSVSLPPLPHSSRAGQAPLLAGSFP